jgi:hypothetical protein
MKAKEKTKINFQPKNPFARIRDSKKSKLRKASFEKKSQKIRVESGSVADEIASEVRKARKALSYENKFHTASQPTKSRM